MQAWSCGALHAGGVPNHSQHNEGPATLWHDDDIASDWQPHRATDHEGAGEFAVISDVRDARHMRHTNSIGAEIYTLRSCSCKRFQNLQ
jgi:hypothetical protein